MSKESGEKKRRRLSMPDTKVIPFIPALIILAKAGHKGAAKKLDEIVEFLSDINF